MHDITVQDLSLCLCTIDATKYHLQLSKQQTFDIMSDIVSITTAACYPQILHLNCDSSINYT
jgi:hypothetical protein